MRALRDHVAQGGGPSEALDTVARTAGASEDLCQELNTALTTLRQARAHLQRLEHARDMQHMHIIMKICPARSMRGLWLQES